MKIRVLGVEVWYRSIEALRDATLEVAEGEVVFVIGPNGSGKTTLLKTIASIVRPRRGVVYIDGRELSRYSPRELARRLAYIDPHIDRSLPTTVLDLLVTARYPREELFRVSLDRASLEVIDRVSRELGIESLLSRRLDQVSSGELQRVLIARALAQDPEILLVDEPTAFLDTRHKFEVMDILSRIARERSKTLIAASHDLALASIYADKVVVLYRGEVVSIGRPGEALSREVLREVFGVDIVEVSIEGRRIPVPIGPLRAPREPIEKRVTG